MKKTTIKMVQPIRDEAVNLENSGPESTRHDMQWGRRLFHFVNGSTVATLYALFLGHKQVVYILGTFACLLYLFEQIRIAYPELMERLQWVNRILLRAEEHLKESAAIPYIMGVLLTILTFPKAVALIAIYTLAVGDPLSAIVGINFGKHRIVPGKSLEGTFAFFVCCFVISFLVLKGSAAVDGILLASSLMIALCASVFETLPLRIDDNLTIPLFTAFSAWFWGSIFGLI